MRFVDFITGGTPDDMTVSETPMPAPLPHQVLVKVHAFGVNRADTLQRQGKYPPPKGESEILGLEVSGEVISVGASVTLWEAGQRVFGLVAGGGYAEYVAVDARHLLPVPDKLSMVEAAGVAEVFLTAFQSLHWLAGLNKGQKVLIHAGASGVGLAAIQLAKANDCPVAVTASTMEKLDVCRLLGADLAINYQTQDFVEVIKSNWKGVDVIVDVVGGDYINRNLKALNLDGRVVCLAMLGGRFADKLDMALLLGKRAKLLGSTLRNRSDNYKAKLIEAFADECTHLFDNGVLKANIDRQLKATSIGEAHRRLENNDSVGKLIGVWD